ncbi:MULTISPECIES: ABC transporter permease subunit [unclassified Mycoplasma]|uniref:ABC transporter permease subunit n=1 Tax=unclassified Mycoplasma TaxID=2683645 RepID=UPI002B1DDD10|nr:MULTISPECIES: hypothetical protein [unclassified Mycoplasma]MEA4205943.1 hypothetical protein [Mycoplasma sp. 1199]MEA4333625.1 hypothetical protein [Mycoplasma sp. 1232]
MFTLTANKVMKNFMFEDKKSARRKLYSSLWAVVIGLLFASVIYWIKGIVSGVDTSIFSFIQNVFNFAFRKTLFNNTLLLIVFFSLTGFSVSIAFKSGLFNIGVAGQMMLPGILFFAILAGTRVIPEDVSLGFLFGMLFMSILIGAIIGAVPGILKAYFNVHEVISTIFLNWIITFIGIWLFTDSNEIFMPITNTDVRTWIGLEHGVSGSLILTKLDNQLGISVEKLFIYIGLGLTAILALVIWFVYSKTTLGYKIKMVGLNKTNSKYVGTNEKLVTTAVMAISGGLAGLAGFFYIVIWQKQLIIKPQAPLAVGFESIAIALIALNNPFGVIGASFLYAILQNSQLTFAFDTSNGPTVSKDFFPIITGIIIFMAALSVMFYKLRPMHYIWKQIVLMCHKEYWQNFAIYHKFTTRSHVKKSFRKARALYVEKLLSENSEISNKEIDEKCNAYFNDWVIEYNKMVAENREKINSLISELHEYKKQQNKKLQDLSTKLQFKEFYSEQLNKFVEYWSINEHVKELDNNSPAYLRALMLAKEKAHADWRLHVKENYLAIFNSEKFKILEEVSNETKRVEFEILELKSKISNTSIKDEIKVLRKYSKAKRAIFAKYKQNYENRVAQLIVTLKGHSAEERMAIYDEISKEKFALQKIRTDLGLDEYLSAVQKSKTLRSSRKTVYGQVKTKIYNDFMLKHFVNPWDNRVKRIQDQKAINTEGDN